jgi:uncharacterized DUF497 family protein
MLSEAKKNTINSNKHGIYFKRIYWVTKSQVAKQVKKDTERRGTDWRQHTSGK